MMPYEDLPRVAAVLDKFAVVLNVGSTTGIQVGQRFVFFKLGEAIVDPITGKSLGRLEIVLGTGEVKHLQEMMCTVRSARRRRSQRVNPLTGNVVETMEDAPFSDIAVGDLARPA